MDYKIALKALMRTSANLFGRLFSYQPSFSLCILLHLYGKMNEDRKLKCFNWHQTWIKMKYVQKNVTIVYTGIHKIYIYIVSDFCNFAFYDVVNLVFQMCGQSEIILWMALLGLPQVEA